MLDRSLKLQLTDVNFSYSNGGMLFCNIVLLMVALLSYYCFVLLVRTRLKVAGSFGGPSRILFLNFILLYLLFEQTSVAYSTAPKCGSQSLPLSLPRKSGSLRPTSSSPGKTYKPLSLPSPRASTKLT